MSLHWIITGAAGSYQWAPDIFDTLVLANHTLPWFIVVVAVKRLAYITTADSLPSRGAKEIPFELINAIFQTLNKLHDNRRAYTHALTCLAPMQIYWNKRKCLHKKRVELTQDWFGTQTCPMFHCFGTPIWLPHVVMCKRSVRYVRYINFLTRLSFLDFVAFVVTTRILLNIRGNVRFLRQTWLPCLCCSSRPSSRPTNWSAVSTANVSEGELK